MIVFAQLHHRVAAGKSPKSSLRGAHRHRNRGTFSRCAGERTSALTSSLLCQISVGEGSRALIFSIDLATTRQAPRAALFELTNPRWRNCVQFPTNLKISQWSLRQMRDVVCISQCGLQDLVCVRMGAALQELPVVPPASTRFREPAQKFPHDPWPAPNAFHVIRRRKREVQSKMGRARIMVGINQGCCIHCLCH